jgi:LysM repeat protein
MATSTTGQASSTASAKPSPTQSGLIDTCTTFYKAVAGDTCEKVVNKYGTFTEDEFIKWNPAVGDDCAAIWAKTYYCVGIPGTPSSRPSSTVTATGTSVPSPTQSGLIDSCTTFYKAVAGDTCEKVVNNYGTFTEDVFIKWNPAVGDDCSAIWAKTYYCVGIPGTPTSRPTATTATSTGTTGPSPTQSGIIDTCTRYYKAQAGDDCSTVVKQFGIFYFEDFLKWNPAVGADCSAFWAKTYYCVGMLNPSSHVKSPDSNNIIRCPRHPNHSNNDSSYPANLRRCSNSNAARCSLRV